MIKKARLSELDALRGVAALMVCLFHFSLISPGSFLNLKAFKYGCTGVDLFFMISGFVIFMSLEKSKQITDFWFLRLIRLFPAYWLSIIIAVFSYIYLSYIPISLNWSHVLGNFLMLQPLFKTQNLVDAYWTLYVELFFYFFISVIWILRLFKKIEIVIWVGLACLLIINSLYLILENSSPNYVRMFIITRSIMPLISYFGFFASGILYYHIYKNGWTINRIILLTFCFLLTILIHNISGRIDLFLNITEHLACVSCFNLLFILIVNIKAEFLKVSWLTFIGGISYSLYLIHESFGISVTQYLLPLINPQIAVVIGIVSSLILAATITYIFELPIQKWLKTKYNSKGLNLIHRAIP